MSTHPLLVDLGIAAVVTVGALVFEAADAAEVGATLDPVDFVACALAAAIILLRRVAPLPVLGVAVVAGAWSLWPDDQQAVLRIAACLALYTVASTHPRRTAWTAGAVTAVVLFGAATITTSDPWYAGDSLELIAWPAVATAVGDAVRSRRAYLVAQDERATALRERAERAEQVLAEEARRQVAEERLHIARELHDVVAHHIAVINVQAGVAAHLMRSDPVAADEALGLVRRGARDVLEELSAILGVMRRGEETDPVDPLPALDRLDQLVAGLRDGGLDVEWHTTGERRTLTPAGELAAYRIVQEALTNVRRHGADARAVLRLDFGPEALEIEVVNRSRPPEPEGNRRGLGLIGMTERAAAAGGTIAVGPTGSDGFRVHAVLPIATDPVREGGDR